MRRNYVASTSVRRHFDVMCLLGYNMKKLHVANTWIFFVEAIWNPLQNLISQWVHKYRQVNLITGPVFDYNGDGIADSYDGLTR